MLVQIIAKINHTDFRHSAAQIRELSTYHSSSAELQFPFTGNASNLEDIVSRSHWI